jgi:hypothetical protein
LKPHIRMTVETLLRKGRSQREVERLTGVDRKTIRRYEREGREVSSPSNSPGVATGCEGRESGVSGSFWRGNSPTPATGSGAPRGFRCQNHPIVLGMGTMRVLPGRRFASS